MFSSARTLSVALAATLLIASCGSDDAASDTSTATTQAAVAATTADSVVTSAPDSTADASPASTDGTTEDTTMSSEAPTQDVDADAVAAEGAVLTLAELPDGWTEAPAEVDRAAEIDGRLAACVEVDNLTPTDTRATTADFTSPDGSLVVNESVGTHAAELDARTIIARLTNPDVPACFAAAYSELGAAALAAGAIADGAEIGEVTASRLAVGSAGDATQAIRIVVPIAAGGEVTVDQVLVRSGRSIAVVTFEGRLGATPVETIDEIVTAAASRLPS